MINFAIIVKKLKKRAIDFPSRTLYISFIFLLLLSFVSAFMVFCIYIWKGPKVETPKEKEAQLNLELYQKVKESFEQREKNIEEGLQKQLPDPFR